METRPLDMQVNSFSYSLKVWLTSVGLAPIIYLVIESCIRKNHYSSATYYLNEQIETYAMCVVFGGIFSLLTWALFFLIVKVITIYFSSARMIKYIIVVAGVLLTTCTFAVFLPPIFDIHNEFFYLMLSNCICITGGSLYYNLESRKDSEMTLVEEK